MILLHRLNVIIYKLCLSTYDKLVKYEFSEGRKIRPRSSEGRYTFII